MSEHECPTCGKSNFQSWYGLKQHHSKTHGEPHPDISAWCDVCGDPFRVSPSEPNRMYCSQECRNRAERYTLECEVCGTQFQVPKGRRETARFCSYKCKHAGHSAEQTGSGNSRYKGGPEPYGPGWTKEKRKSIRARDGHRCQSCGISQEEHIRQVGKKLEVHHIVPARQIDDPVKRHADSNLITLCTSCHPKWERIAPLRPMASSLGD